MSLLSRLAVSAARAYGALSSNPNAVSTSYLVVAGGGGGAHAGSGTIGGGGGAGGFRTGTSTLSTQNTYTVVIGAGGALTAYNVIANSGIDSSISGTGLTTVTSTGGGKGGNQYGVGDGGSGGGAGGLTATIGLGNTPSTSPSQGNNGGTGTSSSNYGGGGGGGAGAVGGNGTGVAGGVGGAGSSSSISGSSVTYAGGGGGGLNGNNAGGAGGTGGGGAAGSNLVSATSGTANTGGGGGGMGQYTTLFSGSGGSGIVIISYTSATPKFVGGTLTTSGGNQIHTFTSSGTLSPLTPVTASYLVVAGGGGGGAYIGGGGGAGGLLTSSTTLYSGATYVVTVGAGGTAGINTSTAPGSGTNSVISGTGLTTVTSTGGGGGGYSNTSVWFAGSNGGSGGGGGTSSMAGGTGTSGQGNAGGAGSSNSGTTSTGGGGGGANAVGGTGVASTAGNGGNGTASSISGSSVTYAGGGGGAVHTSFTGTSTGGSGGGGAGGSSSATGVSGTTNLGAGGGGAGVGYNGGAGGSGIVIISYAGSQVFNGGLVTSSGGNTIHTFNATGALTPVTNNLNNSLRFRSSASAYLNRTPTLAGNRKTWTWSGWVKRGLLVDATNDWRVFSARNASDYTLLSFRKTGSATPNALYLEDSSTGINIITTQVFRDPSAWYHVVIAVDTTQATAANRVKIYINGNQVTAFNTATYPTLNGNTWMNNTVPHGIGIDIYSVDQYFDGYMTDINFIDGQALEPYYFGNNDAYGNWKPIKYTGMYGTNGFYLTFADTSALTTSSNVGLGKDTSGNGNFFATNNISITAGTTYDAMLDVPTNTSATAANYCVLSPLNYRTYTGSVVPTISNANLTVTQASLIASCIGTATMGVTASGKYYWEATFVSGSGSNNSFLGVVAGQLQNTSAADLGYYSNEYAYRSGNGNKYSNNTSTAYGSSYTSGDVIGFALDLDAGTLTFYKNNTSQGVAYSSLSASETYFPAFDTYYNNTFAYNFGQRPFAYTAPSGHIAINTYNLPTPTILQGNKYMDAVTYNGSDGSQKIVMPAQFYPDLVWAKSRNNITNNILMDSVRGGNLYLSSNTTTADTTSTGLATFSSNGITWTGGASGVNASTYTYVDWAWNAGSGSSSSNTSGSITSTVSVNTTAGFSVVTYTGTGANATVGHGLGVAPSMIIAKSRSVVADWNVYHTSLGATKALFLNRTIAADTNIAYWNNTSPTSSVFSLGITGDVNTNASTNVAYCWAEIAGFSKFTSYTGNGSTDGSFIFTGFRPKFIMIKRTDAVESWEIFDTSRSSYNTAVELLEANSSGAESTSAGNAIDILSNGFKQRNTRAATNASGGTYIVMAFASNPFNNSNAR